MTTPNIARLLFADMTGDARAVAVLDPARRLLPWPSVQPIASAVGINGLLWMFGLLATLRIHPHVVEPAALQLRNSVSLDLLLPWSEIAEVRTPMRSLEGTRNIRVDDRASDRALSVGVGSQTNSDVVLREPRVFRLDQTGSEPLAGLGLYVDEPKAPGHASAGGAGPARPSVTQSVTG